MKQKAFTLIEILIVLGIICLLFWILFKVYTTVAEISFRTEQQKAVNQELLYVSDFLQNFSNRNSIDYSRYESESQSDSWSLATKYVNMLVNNSWFTDVLYMSGEDWQFSIYSSGKNCNMSWMCNLYLNNSGHEIQLTSDQVYMSKARFKIIPYDDWYSIDTCNTNQFACRNHRWFWFFVNIYSKSYSDQRWTNNVYMSVQQFFNN